MIGAAHNSNALKNKQEEGCGMFLLFLRSSVKLATTACPSHLSAPPDGIEEVDRVLLSFKGDI